MPARAKYRGSSFIPSLSRSLQLTEFVTVRDDTTERIYEVTSLSFVRLEDCIAQPEKSRRKHLRSNGGPAL